VALLVVLCLSLFAQLRRFQAAAPIAENPLPRFWQSFLSGSKPTSIVVPAPLLVAWQDPPLTVRDSTVSQFSDWSKSPVLLELAKQWGPPRLSQAFMVVSHTLAAVSLLQYLERHRQPAEIVATHQLAVDAYHHRNTILVGGPHNTTRFHGLLANQNFEIADTSPTVILNLRPEPGEPDQYREALLSDRRMTFPGIIAVLPKSQDGTSSLLLIGKYPAALAWMLSSPEGLKLLDQEWEKSHRPETWEMVVQAEMNGNTVLSVRPLGLRATSP
jgi:hypothetical protein